MSDGIAVRDLSVYYETMEALIRLNMDILPGMLTLLLGANGAGKTTFISAVSGLLFDRIKRKFLFDEELGVSGSITIDQEEILFLPPHERVNRGIIHCPEKRGLFSEMTVMDNLMTGAFLRKDKQGIKNDLDKTFGLFPELQRFRHKEAGFMSGGEQQMVAIGRALMARPRYLLMDEPMAGLAPVNRRRIKDTVFSLLKERIGIFITEQNSKAFLEPGGKIYIIGRGTIAFEGTAEEAMKDEYICNTYFSV